MKKPSDEGDDATRPGRAPEDDWRRTFQLLRFAATVPAGSPAAGGAAGAARGTG